MSKSFFAPYTQSLRDFCQRWQVQELWVFGSILRDDFRPDSDIDLLVSFKPGAGWTLIDWNHMENELQEMTGRKVDLVSRKAVESSSNWIRRENILNAAEALYGEG